MSDLTFGPFTILKSIHFPNGAAVILVYGDAGSSDGAGFNAAISSSDVGGDSQQYFSGITPGTAVGKKGDTKEAWGGPGKYKLFSDLSQPQLNFSVFPLAVLSKVAQDDGSDPTAHVTMTFNNPGIDGQQANVGAFLWKKFKVTSVTLKVDDMQPDIDTGPGELTVNLSSSKEGDKKAVFNLTGLESGSPKLTQKSGQQPDSKATVAIPSGGGKKVQLEFTSKKITLSLG